jgi:hypothetical protein
MSLENENFKNPNYRQIQQKIITTTSISKDLLHSIIIDITNTRYPTDQDIYILRQIINKYIGWGNTLDYNELLIEIITSKFPSVEYIKLFVSKGFEVYTVKISGEKIPILTFIDNQIFQGDYTRDDHLYQMYNYFIDKNNRPFTFFSRKIPDDVLPNIQKYLIQKTGGKRKRCITRRKMRKAKTRRQSSF